MVVWESQRPISKCTAAVYLLKLQFTNTFPFHMSPTIGFLQVIVGNTVHEKNSSKWQAREASALHTACIEIGRTRWAVFSFSSFLNFCSSSQCSRSACLLSRMTIKWRPQPAKCEVKAPRNTFSVHAICKPSKRRPSELPELRLLSAAQTWACLPYDKPPWPCSDAVAAVQSAFLFSFGAHCCFVEPDTTEKSRTARMKTSEIKRPRAILIGKRRVLLEPLFLFTPL